MDINKIIEKNIKLIEDSIKSCSGDKLAKAQMINALALITAHLIDANIKEKK